MMSVLKNKIDFMVLIAAHGANVNGDPLNGNRPRTDYNGFGEMSDVCIKRKIRNRMQDLGHRIFVQSQDRCDDGCGSLKERAEKELGKGNKNQSPQEYAQKACRAWLDVRSFGQVFAFAGGKEKGDGVSVGVRGPVSIHQAVSISPVEIQSMQITKSVNGEPAAKSANSESTEKRSSDTMGMKHFVRFGLYVVKGAINVQLAEKTGFSEEDAETVKECLRTLFCNDASSARPEGSMEVLKVYWFRHNCKDGQYPSAKVHRSLEIALKNEGKIPESVEDYNMRLLPLEGLDPEVIDGI